MATKKFDLPKRSELQFYYPTLSHNGFGYQLVLRTAIVIGKTAFAIQLFGFGFGFCYDVQETLYGKIKL